MKPKMKICLGNRKQLISLIIAIVTLSAMLLLACLLTSCAKTLSQKETKEICDIDNYTAVITYKDNGFITDFAFERSALFQSYIDSETNSVKLSDFHWCIYIYKVSEKEEYYKVTIEHTPTGDCIYEVLLEADEKICEKREPTLTPASVSKKVARVMEALPDLKFSPNKSYPDWDYISIKKESDDDDESQYIYAISVSDDNKLEAVKYTEKLGMFSLGWNDINFTLKDVGTTVKPQ